MYVRERKILYVIGSYVQMGHGHFLGFFLTKFDQIQTFYSYLTNPFCPFSIVFGPEKG